MFELWFGSNHCQYQGIFLSEACAALGRKHKYSGHLHTFYSVPNSGVEGMWTLTWPYMFHSALVFWAVVYSSKRKGEGGNTNWAPLFSQALSLVACQCLTTFQLYSTESPSWVWELGKGVALPRITQSGARGFWLQCWACAHLLLSPQSWAYQQGWSRLGERKTHLSDSRGCLHSDWRHVHVKLLLSSVERAGVIIRRKHQWDHCWHHQTSERWACS